MLYEGDFILKWDPINIAHIRQGHPTLTPEIVEQAFYEDAGEVEDNHPPHRAETPWIMYGYTEVGLIAAPFARYEGEEHAYRVTTAWPAGTEDHEIYDELVRLGSEDQVKMRAMRDWEAESDAR